MNPIQDTANQLVRSLDATLNKIIVKGLKLKGYEFQSYSDLIDFIKGRCKIIDSVHNRTKIYYIDDEAFLMHVYDPEPIINQSEQILTIENGYYKYL